MRQKALVFVLAVGAVLGFASGLYRCHYHDFEGRRGQRFEDHIADVCMSAAERSRSHSSHAENVP
jgi:uncharacterized protein YodC (DUF2158 family)